MQYLRSFNFPIDGDEFDYMLGVKRKCYNTIYPFKVLSGIDLERLDFEPVTILYGGNGSGKTTALNVMAEKLKVQREAAYNKSNFFDDYVEMCQMDAVLDFPQDSRILTSDDVFDYMLDIRTLNQGIHNKREEVFDEYLEAKYSKFKMNSMEDYDELKKVNQSRRFTQSKFVRENLMDNVRTYSNGESAYKYFTERIKENSLYFLDEPENSLSPGLQMELVSFLEDSVRFFGCQFIISTHSPFILAMKGAKIYDLDEESVEVKNWTQLKNVRTFYEFFKKHEGKF